MDKGKIIIVSGPSGVGKGTVLKRLMSTEEFPLVLSVSATTRAPRPGEKDGKDYYFLTEEEFERRRNNNEFIECFQVFKNGAWYGTLRSTIDDALEKGDWLVLEIDLKGARKVLEHWPEAITVFIEPPSMERLAQQLSGRGTEDEAALRKRMGQAADEIAESSFYQYKIINDDLDRAVADFRKVLAH